MKPRVGIWVDHRKALVVSLVGERAAVRRIESGVEGRLRLAGGSRSATPYGPQDVASDCQRNDRRVHQLRRYYREVARAVRDARSVYILGPGRAPCELRKEMEARGGAAGRTARVERSDKMTTRQLLARVKDFYGLASERICGKTGRGKTET